MEIGVPYQYDISKSLFTGALPGDSNLGQGFNGRTDGRGRTACTYAHGSTCTSINHVTVSTFSDFAADF